LIALGGIYFFILLGYLSKRYFKEIDQKSFVLFSIYFLQPMLVFWGLTTKDIDATVIIAPAIFTVVIVVALIISYVSANILFSSQKDRSIATVASIVGNTGNLGIPLGIALFGVESIIYTSIINLVNAFVVYTVGVFFYARGEFSVKESFIKIFKLPFIWFGFFALVFNYLGFRVPNDLKLSLEMGAYATMVIQLAILGMYLESVEYKKIQWRLFNFITIMKFILMPLIAIVVLNLFVIDDLVYNVIMLEVLVPLAVMNVNLASLYECKPTQVAFLIFSTSILFGIYLVLVKDKLFF
jgi:predicted permease